MPEKRQKDKYDIAAHWWGQQIRRPIFDNGDGLQSVLGTFVSLMTPQPREEQITKFEQVLAEMLRTHPEIYSLDVDYEPNRPLREAAQTAGGNFQFPWKTSMWIDNEEDTIRVARGYRAETETIWPEPKK